MKISFKHLVFFAVIISITVFGEGSKLKLNELDYFETQGFNALIYASTYNGNFDDSKMAGIEFIHHGVRTVTNGDVRLNPTPEQWDPIPEFIERTIDSENQTITARVKYDEYDFEFSIEAKASGDNLLISVILDKALPEALEGRAGFNIEFLPSTYFGKTYMMDGRSGLFPLYPSSEMMINSEGKNDPLPLATGKQLSIAPEDPERHILVESDVELNLYDGRNKAQNGWFVLRSLIPSGKSGKVIEWTFTPSTVPDWKRKPVILHSQVGYHPDQEKVALIELDKADTALTNVNLLKVLPSGEIVEAFSSAVENWGQYLRYNYLRFDFSRIVESGTYILEYGEQRSHPFIIGQNVYKNIWHPTMDVFFPVQMDHIIVNEAYRVWHGKSHMDDALQAPVNHEHFDLYAQGPTTDTEYQPGEHIPGLNMGGWFDAGDFDIRTQTHYATVLGLVENWEQFGIDRDQTLVDYESSYVDLHTPDGKPDLLQQIEHGTLALIAQFRAVGHAIPGIIVGDLSQYTHLGDAVTMTDNLIYNPELGVNESNGFESGKFDDRWAFTTHTSALNYGSIAALTASSRALKGYNDELAAECLETALRIWDEEQASEPALFRHGNTTGSFLEIEMLRAATQLLITTGDEKYKTAIWGLKDYIVERFPFVASNALSVLDLMDDEYRIFIREQVVQQKERFKTFTEENPFGVMITRGGWAGSGIVITIASTNYHLHKAFPDLVSREEVFKGLNYVLGCHPDSSISFVSAVGAHSKKVGYGNNRANFSFIAGGIVPGVLILKPDFPENKEDWPFLWGENEYVINLGARYLFLANAVDELLNNP